MRCCNGGKSRPRAKFRNFRIGASDWIVTQKALPIDEEYDSRMVIILTGKLLHVE